MAVQQEDHGSHCSPSKYYPAPTINKLEQSYDFSSTLVKTFNKVFSPFLEKNYISFVQIEPPSYKDTLCQYVLRNETWLFIEKKMNPDHTRKSFDKFN